MVCAGGMRTYVSRSQTRDGQGMSRSVPGLVPPARRVQWTFEMNFTGITTSA